MTLCSLAVVAFLAQAEVPLTPEAEPVERPQLSSTRVLASIGAGLLATGIYGAPVCT